MDRPTLKRVGLWQEAGIIDAATAERIRVWESEHAPDRSTRLGRFAFAFGGVLLGAGILLFVAANWALLSPWARFAVLAATVAILHIAGGVIRARSTALSTTLHAVGTAALGGGIFLAGQAFNLAQEWPAGFLLWAIGAGFALWALRDWPHVLWVAALVPMWLTSEWHAAQFAFAPFFGGYQLPVVGLFVLGAAYLIAVGGGHDDVWRRALSRLGAVLLLVTGVLLPFAELGVHAAPAELPTQMPVVVPPRGWLVSGWVVAALLPVLVGWRLRGRAAWPLLVALVFAVVVGVLDTDSTTQRLLMHVLFLSASAALVWWGLHDSHRLRVNVGMIGFALTVLSFYYSSVFDKLGRSIGLVGLGLLFLAGGWVLERARRRLIERIGGGGK